MTKKIRSFTEEELTALLLAKDKQIIAILYERYSVALFGVIYKLLGDKDLSEEQLQNCFLKIWKYAESYDSSKGRLYTWMLRIARNTAIDATRSKRFKQKDKIQSLEKSVSIIESTNNIEQHTDGIGVRDLIEKLNTKYALIIDKIYFQGYTQAETAKELELPLGTVKTRTRKALGLLKEYLIK
jgi:RNA polymerase sigma-70 factor (ECF subfamily)